MLTRANALRSAPRSQHGSVVIALVMAAAAVALLFIVANITINAREFNSTVAQRKQQYLEATAKNIENWYRKNASYIDRLPGTPAFTEEDLFKAAGVTKSFDARIAITDLMGQPGSNLFYRNIVVWIPAPGVEDTSSFAPSGVFRPAYRETQYRVINGQLIEGQNIGATQTKMRELARLLESRAKAKFEMDPLHDARTNYLRAQYCSAPNSEEIPCTTAINSATGWVAIGDPILRLRSLATLNDALTTDAWGNPIEFNNYAQSTHETGLPGCADNTTTTDDTEMGEPPFLATLRTTTPWGTVLCMRAVQAIN